MTAPMHPKEFRERLEAELVGPPGAPRPADDLAAGKQLLRRRRATWVAALATLGVVGMLPLALSFTDGDGTGHGERLDPPPADEGQAEWRWESFRRATFQVPDSWGYGSPVSWCLHPEASVRRPADYARSIRCSDGIGYGVQFYDEGTYDSLLSPGQVVYDDSERSGWVGHEVVDDVVIQVFSGSEAVTRRILESVQPIDGLDPNGCAPVTELDERIGEPPVLPTLGSVESVSVCRYDVAAGERLEELLVQSERLTGAEAEKALAGLHAADVTEERHRSCPKVINAEAVQLVLDGHAVWVNWGSDCREIGVLDGSQLRELTAEVMHWALSPGWGGAFPVRHVADHDRFVLRTLDAAEERDFEEVVWQDVRFSVPPKWDPAAAGDWCVGLDHPAQGVPRVSLPGMQGRELLCHPRYAYGVSVGSSAAISFAHASGDVWQYGDEDFYPDGAWISIVYDDEWAVTIRTPDRALTEQIAESVTFGG